MIILINVELFNGSFGDYQKQGRLNTFNSLNIN